MLRGQALYARGAVLTGVDCQSHCGTCGEPNRVSPVSSTAPWSAEQLYLKAFPFKYNFLQARAFPFSELTLTPASVYRFARSRSSHLSTFLLLWLLLCSCPPWCSPNPPVPHQRRGGVDSCPSRAGNQLPLAPASCCLCRSRSLP